MNYSMNYLAMLKTGDIVLSTKGSYGIVLKGTAEGDLIRWFLNKERQSIKKFRTFGMINSDLTFKFDGKDNRIIKVWGTNDKHHIGTLCSDTFANFESMGFELVYEEKVKEVTMSEVEAKFGCKVKIKNND